MTEILGGLLLMAALVTIVFIIAKYNYLIKKAMIEKDIYVKRVTMRYRYLDLGCIVFGLGVGLLVSSIFTYTEMNGDTIDLLIWGTILIFGAGGLILAHFIRKKLEG
ncbi:MAG: hypothetical protein AAF634_09745 [Bacteroidota bacterium]